MSFFNSIRKVFSGSDSPTGSEEVQEKAYGDTLTLDMLARSSKVVSESEALGIASFYACVRDKAETIGQLPLKLYETNRNGRQLVMQGRKHRIFTQKPCDYLTLQQFLEMAVVSLETNGAFYAYIERNDRGSPMNIIPFAHQRNVVPNMDVNGNVYYTYVTNDNRPVMAARPDDLFIISMFTTDGYTPVRPVYHQARLLGIADSQDETYKSFSDDGITAQMALKTDQVFNNKDAAERLREDMKKSRGPNGKKHIPIFEQGLAPISLKLSPKEMELLNSQQFTLNRICKMTRVPIHRVGEPTGKSNTSTLTELDEAYFRDSLNPILTKVEHAMNTILGGGYQVEFNRKAFYAGSPHRLVEAVEREVKGGLASINEGRIDLGRESVEGGDVFGIDNNNVTYGTWDELPKIQEQLYGRSNQDNQPNRNDQGNTDEE